MKLSDMNISLENWIRNKLQEVEEMQDYSVAIDTVRCWINEYNYLNHSEIKISICDACGTNEEIILHKQDGQTN